MTLDLDLGDTVDSDLRHLPPVKCFVNAVENGAAGDAVNDEIGIEPH